MANASVEFAAASGVSIDIVVAGLAGEKIGFGEVFGVRLPGLCRAAYRVWAASAAAIGRIVGVVDLFADFDLDIGLPDLRALARLDHGSGGYAARRPRR